MTNPKPNYKLVDGEPVCQSECVYFFNCEGIIHCRLLMLIIDKVCVSGLLEQRDQYKKEKDNLLSRLNDERYAPLEQWKQIRDERDQYKSENECLTDERDSARAQLLEATETERHMLDEVNRLKDERDEARSEVCSLWSHTPLKPTHNSKDIAKEHGWDYLEIIAPSEEQDEYPSKFLKELENFEKMSRNTSIKIGKYNDLPESTD